MSFPIRLFLPLVLAATVASASAEPVGAETLPEPPCGLERGAAEPARQESAALTASASACHLTVFFDTGSAILVPDARLALDAAAPHVIAHMAHGGRVRVDGFATTGHADETGNLAARRARAVASHLERAWGVPRGRLALRGWAPALPDGNLPTRTVESQRATIILDGGLVTTDRGRRTWPLASRSRHLDLDDFGGARNPLPGPVIRVWTSPGSYHD